MATIEKLVVQLFEKSRSINQHLEHQKRICHQHLASKLLIHGFAPPPWLLNPDSASSDSDLPALNKEELISGILLSRTGPIPPYPTDSCLYGKPIVKVSNIEVPDDIRARQCLSSNYLDEDGHDVSLGHVDGTEDRPSTVPPCHVDGTVDTLGYVPMSPEDQTDTRISNTCSKPELSLASLQRSRSRQKALELRNSAKASAKSRLGNESNVGIPTTSKTFTHDEPFNGLRESAELFKASAFSSDACAKEEAAVEGCSNRERRSDACSDSLSQSGGNGVKEIQIGESEKNEKMSSVDGSRIARSGGCCRQSTSVDHQIYEKQNEVYIGRNTRSRSGKAQQTEIDVPAYRRVTRSSFHNQSITKEEGIGKSNIYSGKIARSRSCGEREAEPEDSRSKAHKVGVKPKQLDFDEVKESSLGTISNRISGTKGMGKSKERTRADSIEGNSVSLCCGLSADGTSERYAKSLAYDSMVLDSEVSHSLPKSDRMSGQLSYLPDCPAASQVTLECVLGMPVENDADTTLSGAVVDGMTDLSSELHKFESEGRQSPCKEADDLSLPNADSHLAIDLRMDAVEATMCLEKTRHESSSGKKCKASLGAETTERFQFSCSPNLAGSSTSALDSLPANTSDETRFENGLETMKTVSPSRSSCSEKRTHEPSSCINSEATLDAQTTECVQLSPCWNLAKSLPPAHRSVSADTSDETRCERELEMMKMHSPSICEDIKDSCLSSHVKVVGSPNLPEFQAGVNVCPEYNYGYAKGGSLPCCKRRKTEYQPLNKSASPSVRLNCFHPINKNIPKRSSSGEIDKSPISQNVTVSHNADEIAPFDTDQSDKASLIKEPKLAIAVQHEEDEVSLGRSIEMPLTCDNAPLLTSSVSEAKQSVSAEPSDCFSEEGQVRENQTSNTICSEPMCIDNLVRAEHATDRHSAEKFTFTDALTFSVGSPLIERMNLDVTGANEIVPELEGFIIGENSEGVQNAEAGHIHDEGILFQSDQVDQTSLLEQIRKSMSICTPGSPFPSAYKLHKTPDVYRSVPNGILENIDVRTRLFSNSNDAALQGRSFSDCFLYPRNRLGLDTTKPFMSPLRKGIERISCKSGDSDKLISGSLELTCFPIQEDHESSEEDVNVNENDVVRTDMKRIDSIMSGSIREPLGDITAENETTLAPNHAVERVSLESITTEMNFSEMQNKGGKKRITRQSKQRKENHSLSFGGNSMKKQSESLCSRFSKPKLSGKSSLRSRGQSFSEKDPKRNNIVSNVKSFIPLVQQKQAAAAVPAKRDVKVKALEAAEAAKRLAEKKENERKQKKEALKLERARLEEENLKQMELKKKLKEEEKKKRDAENAAKKRQREEEDRKDKERKRKRIEEARCQQKQAEEKIHAWREESRCGTADDKAHERKDSDEKIGKQVDKANETFSRMSEDEIVGNDRREADGGLPIVNDNKASTGSSDTGKVGGFDVAESSTPNCVKDDNPANRSSREQSYDISPFQWSDDEAEDEDDIPNKKFIPTWASRSSVALALPSLQHIDPYSVFPPGSFCSLAEVLLPRRLAQK